MSEVDPPPFSSDLPWVEVPTGSPEWHFQTILQAALARRRARWSLGLLPFPLLLNGGGAVLPVTPEHARQLAALVAALGQLSGAHLPAGAAAGAGVGVGGLLGFGWYYLALLGLTSQLGITLHWIYWDLATVEHELDGMEDLIDTILRINVEPAAPRYPEGCRKHFFQRFRENVRRRFKELEQEMQREFEAAAGTLPGGQIVLPDRVAARMKMYRYVRQQLAELEAMWRQICRVDEAQILALNNLARYYRKRLWKAFFAA